MNKGDKTSGQVKEGKPTTKENTKKKRGSVFAGLPAPPPELIGLNRKIDPEKWKQVLNTLWIKRQKEIHSASSAIHNSATAMMNATRDLLAARASAMDEAESYYNNNDTNDEKKQERNEEQEETRLEENNIDAQIHIDSKDIPNQNDDD